MGPKSPIPTTTRRMQLKPFNSDMGHQNERYVTIIKKAQKAFRNSSKGLESPKILQKFLSTQESFNSQDQSSDQSFTSPYEEDNRSLDEAKNYGTGKFNRLRKGHKLSLFAKKKLSCLSEG